MKKILFVVLTLVLGIFGSIDAGLCVDTTLLGPQLYVRNQEEPDIYTATFRAAPGLGTITIKNGRSDGDKRIEDSMSSATIAVNDIVLFGPSDFNQNTYLMSSALELHSENTLTVTLASKPGSYIMVEIIEDLSPPVVSLSADPEEVFSGDSVVLRWNSDGADSLIIEPDIGTVSAQGETSIVPDENTTYTITASGLGGTASESVDIRVFSAPGPVISFKIEPSEIEPGETATLQWAVVNADSLSIDSAIGMVPSQGSLIVYPDHTTDYRLTATGPTGSSGALARVVVIAEPAPQPEGSFGNQYQDQIPADATLAAYDPERFSMITGIVHDKAGIPIENVSVNILDNPEYGTAYTNADGRFSIPVEGGGSLVAVFSKQDYLEVHRRISIPWNDVAETAPIQMTTIDQAYTVAAFDGDPQTIIRHRSSEVSDQWGARACTLVLTGDNRAFSVDEHGNDIQELETITVRATEYTTLASMPAELPPNSAYTYCAEFSVDGARNVRFDKPVFAWVNNFLGFEVGEVVPAGFYDRDQGLWVPVDNGRVVRLLDMNGDGVSDALDADGNGVADDINSDGNFEDEIKGLEDSSHYPPGTTFWRMPLAHFSPGDFNKPFGTPGDAENPNASGIVIADSQLPDAKDCKRSNGSFVEERSRIMHEDIPIAGTDLKLYYTSNRVDGYETRITVPASGPSIPSSLKRIDVYLSIAGNIQKMEFEPQPGLKAEFYWDGTDYLGQTLSTPIVAHVRVGFVYDSVFYQAGDFDRAFAQPGLEATEIPARQEITLWKQSDVMVHPPCSKTSHDVAEGWTLSLQHHLNPQDLSLLHKGDGTTIANNVRTISNVAGTGSGRYGGTDKPAVSTSLFEPTDVAIDPEGNFYIADRYNHRIRKVDTSGIITTVAGNGIPGYSGDGGPAVEASLSGVYSIAVNNAGEIYLAETQIHRIRKVNQEGIISTVAGTGINGYSGDNGPATQAMINYPYGIACDDQGNLYIADTFNQRIRKVDPAGIITTIAGNGSYGFSGDNGPAVQASIWSPFGMTVHEDGTLYFADRSNYRVRMVDPAGIITTIAGNGTSGYSGDGGPAELAQFGALVGVAVDRTGNVYLSDEYGSRIRRISTNGIISTVAGNGTYGDSPQNPVPATLTPFRRPWGIAVDDDGSVYIADKRNHYVRKVSHPAAFSRIIMEDGTVFADPAGRGYVISSNGTHVKTVDLDSGLALYTFEYDADGDLSVIVDRFGSRTVISRDEHKHPTAITSPYGVTTSLVIDENNFLSEIVNPDGKSYVFEYDTHGLMTAKFEPAGHRFEHEYDDYGRLSEVRDEEGGSWTYIYETDENGTTRVEVTTAEGNVTSYLDHTDASGFYTSIITGPDNAETFFSRSADGLTVDKSLTCGSQLNFQYDLDAEFGYPFIRESRQVSAMGLENVSTEDTSYADTNADKIPDLVTRTSSLNGKSSVVINDHLRSMVTKTSPAGRATRLYYNPATLLTESVHTEGFLDANYLYDENGRLTSATTGNRETLYTYNDQGLMASISHAGDAPTTFFYDTMGRPIGIEQSDSSSIEFAYDDNGNLVRLSTPSNVVHEFSFNTVNMKSGYQTPLSGNYQHRYDRDRRLIEMVFPSGKQTNYFYEADRLTHIQTADKDIDISYACASKIDFITDGFNAIEYAYDGKLPTGETLNGTLNASIEWQYNDDYLPDQVTYAGETTQLAYDLDGLLSNAGRYTILRNDANGLPESVVDPVLTLNRGFNGYGEFADQSFVVATQDAFTWELERDARGRIVKKTETLNNAIAEFEYQYDTMGRLLTVFENNVLMEEYQYDANGSRAFATNSYRGIEAENYAYSSEDHLLVAGAATFAYDSDGFLVSKADTSGTTQYQYSSRGELMSAQLPDGTLIEYVHDPLGRRIAKKINNIIQEKYLWQGQTRLLAIFDESDHVVARFEYADGRVPVSMTSAGDTYYLAYDPVGSLRLVADDAGNVVKRVDYDTFGNIIADSNPGVDIWFGFAGGLHDRDIGLVRFGHRDYDPQTGRWTAKDPIFFNGGDTDLYGYCLNDPVNGFDPDGKIIQSLVAGASAGAITGSISFITEIAKGASFNDSAKSAIMTALTSTVSVSLAASGVGAIYAGSAAAATNAFLQLTFEGNINTNSALFSAFPTSVGGVLLGKGGLSGIILGTVTGFISGPSTVAGNSFFSSSALPCK
ncbi:MAG: RHS repeat-associated core domain-containing protein [Thermodesulfobacteriota bacterium]